MATTHNLGFPRIGAQRELKWALEAYWRGEIDEADLLRTGAELRKRHWRLQAAGVDWAPVGDFSFYDHVLDHSVMLGCVPRRFGEFEGTVDLDTYFRMARGRSARGEAVDACEMTKWFDTNYHYIVPEFEPGQRFRLADERLFEQLTEANALGLAAKPVLLGPLSFLWLGKCVGGDFDKLELLDDLLAVYGEIIARLGAMGVAWVQIDEPILVLDLPMPWLQAFESAYNRLRSKAPRILLATYFGELRDKLSRVCTLPVDGLHLDGVRGAQQLLPALDMLGGYKVLSLGLIDGRNIWRTDLAAVLEVLEPIHQRLGERLWLAPSCSLLHVPVDLEFETGMDAELKSWLAFARQKLDELALLREVLRDPEQRMSKVFIAHQHSVQARHRSGRIHREAVRDRLRGLKDSAPRRATPYAERARAQHARLSLPAYPTTTIGSFPQTAEIRRARRRFKDGTIDAAEYEQHMRAAVAEAVRRQEALGLDVLVHGEPERNDMVEYFGGLLEGFALSDNGWVQSYGSRCVKPPIVYGDVARPAPMTLEWIGYAQSLTEKPVKAMLTGPVTILQWSFVRDDQPRVDTCRQIALALRDEIDDLERAGIAVIQVDEPALREGLPLKRGQWQAYLNDAVGCFRLATCAAADDTQIHTHMCYSRFNDIIHAITEMDADVITIETARSDMTLLDAFADFEYPNEIGPGVYDIHSPNTPEVARMVELLERAAVRIAPERLWVNPDCGLKTRAWPEVEAALARMVQAAAVLRGAERVGAA